MSWTTVVPNLIVFLLVLPTLAAAAVALLGAARKPLIRTVALAAVAANLALTTIILVAYLSSPQPATASEAKTFSPRFVPGGGPEPLASTHTTWRMLSFGEIGGIDFYLGIDGINIWLVALTSLLMFSAVLASWQSIDRRVNEYYAWLLLLGTGMLGVFLAFDIILFYIFFELTLVPLYFLIGIWGGPQRRYAAGKFFIYTLVGSVVTLLALLAIVLVCYDRHPDHRLTFSIPELLEKMQYLLHDAAANHTSEKASFWWWFQVWVFLALVAGLAIKVPLVPVHTWLPLAHVEAPTAGSVLLAGVLLKIGTYAFLRLCLPFTPDACLIIGVPLIGGLALIGIIYGAFCSLAQDDIKRLVAYSSVSHMGFCMLGMFALNLVGMSGSLLQMINHGLSTGALFLLVGMLYDRYHTRSMREMGGLGAKLGLLTFCWVFIALSSIGLPGLNGFVGETLCFFGMFSVRPWFSIIAAAGIVLGAWYLLGVLLRRVFFGALKEPDGGEHPVGDMNIREGLSLWPIMALCLVLGVFPQPVLDRAKPDLEVVTSIIDARRDYLQSTKGDGINNPAQARRIVRAGR